MAADRRRRGPALRPRETPLVELPALLRASGHPFLRHQLDPGAAQRAWSGGGAVVVAGGRARPGQHGSGPTYTCLGPAADLEPLLAAVARTGPTPGRLTVEEPAEAPPAWPRPQVHRWHWMTTTGPVPADDRWQVADLDARDPRDATLIDALLDAANPGSFARPGSPAPLAWLGVHDTAASSPGSGADSCAGSCARPRLLAAGALETMPDGTRHLRGVGVLPEARGRGLGAALSSALARRALEVGSGVATLGVYADNLVALGLYRRLGFEVRCTFRSGSVAG